MIRALVKLLEVSEQSDTNMLYKHKVNPRARGTPKKCGRRSVYVHPDPRGNTVNDVIWILFVIERDSDSLPAISPQRARVYAKDR